MTVFIVITVLVMLNLLISLLNELYEKLKQKAKADWCREQAVQLYQYDERKQHSTRKWFKQLYQNMTSGAAGGASSASASGAKSQRRDSVNAEFGLSPALAINVANSTSFDGVATDVKEEDIDEPGVRPTKRLQHLQERAARVGRAYFDDDSRMHTVGPLLSSLKVGTRRCCDGFHFRVACWAASQSLAAFMSLFLGQAWTLNANAPPLELLGVLEQLLRDTLRNTPRLKETLKEGALRTVTLVLEAIENNKLTNPVGSRHPVHDTWRTAQRCCLRCMYRLTTLPTETIATNDAQAAEWSDHRTCQLCVLAWLRQDLTFTMSCVCARACFSLQPLGRRRSDPAAHAAVVERHGGQPDAAAWWPQGRTCQDQASRVPTRYVACPWVRPMTCG